LGKKKRDTFGENDRKSVYFWDFFAFLARYFPSFICSIFMCVLSIALATVQVFQTHLGHDPQRASYMVIFLLGASTVLTLGGFMLSRGRLWATWILVAILATCLLVVLSSVPAPSQTSLLIIYMLSLIFPLLGLLSLNSRRSREMRQQFVYNRSMRASIRGAIGELNTARRGRKDQSKNKTRRK
jgi:hypothetical protein